MCGLTARSKGVLFAARGCAISPRGVMPKNRVLDHQGRSMSSSYTTISPDKLGRLIGTAAAPPLVYVRTDEDFSADPRLIPGAVRRSHLDVQDWASRLTGKSVVVVCHKG